MKDNSKVAARILRQYGSLMNNEDRDILFDNIEDFEDAAKAVFNLGAPFNIREIELLSKASGDLDEDHNFERDGDLWEDSILEKYADHVFNYEYTYNDKALEIDPNIDTEEHHIGVMAQDLEKVNPATIVEDESGYKTVDTGRLALMNAGAIGDIVRRIEELEKHVLQN